MIGVRLDDFAPQHLDGVLRLCEQEGWPTLPGDRARAVQALRAPGVVTVVALDDDAVVGFTHALTDGAIQAYLCLLVVAAHKRRNGIGRKLVTETLARSGCPTTRPARYA